LFINIENKSYIFDFFNQYKLFKMKKKYIIPLSLLMSLGVYSQQSLPFTEIFTEVTVGSGTLPVGWSSNAASPVAVLNGSVNAYSGTDASGSVMFNLFNSVGLAELPLTSPTLTNNSNNTIKLTFDFAAAVRHQGPAALPQTYAQDRFQVFTSTDGGTTYTMIKDYLIGDTGELNTGGIKINTLFTPTATEWVTKTLSLPAGTNKVLFKAFKPVVTMQGNFAYLDNVQFQICNTAVPVGAPVQYNVAYTTVADLVVTGTALTWYSDAALTTSIPSTTPLVSGTTYYVTSTEDGCSSAPLAVLFDETANVNELSLSKVTLFPNPSSGLVTVGGIEQIDVIRIYDVAGKLIYQTKNTQFSVESFQTGIYLVEIQLGASVKKEKLIVK